MRSHPYVVTCILTLLSLGLIAAGGRAEAQSVAFGSSFSYQGQLRMNNAPLSADCDFQFRLFDALDGGNQVGPLVLRSAVTVHNGLFNVELDFGRGVFFGDRYLEVAVAYPAGSGTYNTLAPRQKLLPTPMALFAAGVSDGAVTSSGLATGAVTGDKIAEGAVSDAKIAGVGWAKITGTPLALPPSGPAGGALTGAYPNPDLANNVVTSRTIASGAVGDAKISDVSYAKITGAPVALPPTGAAGGDLTGTYPNPAIAAGAVTDTKIASLSYSKVTGAPTALPPNGAAAGDLTGSYPNPKLADNVVTTRTIADRNVTANKLAEGAVTSRTLAAGAVTSASLANDAVTDAKVRDVAWSKITGSPSTLPPTGTAGGDLTGSYPNPQIADNAVTSRTIAAGAVSDSKISDVAYGKITGAPATLPPTGAAGGDLSGSYPNPNIADQAVTTRTIADRNVTANKLAEGAVTSRTLAAGAVTSVSLANNAVTDAKVRDVAWSKITGSPSTLPPTGTAGGDLTGSYPNPQIADNAVTSRTIAAGAVSDSKISDVAYAKITGAPVTLPPTGAAGGDLSGSYPNPQIADQAVTTRTIADRNVTANKLAEGAVTSRTLAAGAVTSVSLANNAVTDAKVRDVAWSKITGSPSTLPPTGTAGGDLTGSYPNPQIADNAVTSRTIAPGAVNDAKISDVSYGKITGVPTTLPPSGPAGGDLSGLYPNPVIADQAVTTRTIADRNVTANKLAEGAVTSRTIAAGAVTSVSLANDAVTDSKVRDISWSKITGSPSTLPPTGAAGGDLTGAYPNPTIASGAVNDAKISDVAYAKITGAPATLPPSGAAGGDLIGSYPDPQIANSAITSRTLADRNIVNAKLADSVVTSRTIADLGVTSGKLEDNAVSSRSIAAGAVTDAKITTVSYAKVIGAPATLPPSGTAGGDLTGTYPNPTIANNAVTNAKISSVAYAKVTGAPSALPPSGAAGGDLSGTYPNPAIAAGAVTDAKIATVSYAKVTGAPTALPPNGAAGGDLTGTYPNPAIANNAVTNAKISSVAYAKVTGTPTSLPPSGVAGGSLSGTYPNPTLANNSVTTPTIADYSISSSKVSVPLALSGFDTTSSNAILTVTDTGLGRAIDAITYSNRSGIRGRSFGWNGYGVYGIAPNGPMATGIGGESENGYGVVGTNMVTSNFGRLGTSNEGVYGYAGNSDLSGVTGYASLGSGAVGVAGYSDDGTGAYGINQVSGNSGSMGGPDFGVMGEALTGYAGRFKGDVLVNGTLNCSGTKNFMIDHPLDPQNKFLIHSSIEGPERMNLYNGNVVTDAKGVAVVKLPDYFQALNKDFRYQLTVIGQFAQAIIAEEIKGNAFKIRTDKPGVKVSWQVIGTRQDEFARQHPFATEVLKKDDPAAVR